MIEAILIGIVIALALIILLIILIASIKGLKKRSKNKAKNEEYVEANEYVAKEAYTPKEEVVTREELIEEKVEEVVNDNSFELEDLVADVSKEDERILKEQVQTMSQLEPIVINLNQGEGIVIGEGEYECGKYIVEITNGEEVVKIRTSRYVNMYNNGDTIAFETRQKVTPISASISLKKID